MEVFGNAVLSVQLMWLGAIVCSVWFALSCAGYLLDRRKLFGENVWVKPLRFSSSLALHYATFAIVISWLSPTWQTSSTIYVIALIAVASLIFQVGYIGIQAIRAEPSHFNNKTPLMSALNLTMAVMASLVTGPMAIIGVMVLLDPGFQMADAVRYATGFGLVIGTVMTFISAYHLGSRENPFFGDRPDDERRLPLMDWSLERGDLRPAHFFATHMMQATPVAGLICAYLFPDTLSVTVSFAFTLVWAALAVDSYRIAIRSEPISHMWNLHRAFGSVLRTQ